MEKYGNEYVNKLEEFLERERPEKVYTLSERMPGLIGLWFARKGVSPEYIEDLRSKLPESPKQRFFREYYEGSHAKFTVE